MTRAIATGTVISAQDFGLATCPMSRAAVECSGRARASACLTDSVIVGITGAESRDVIGGAYVLATVPKGAAKSRAVFDEESIRQAVSTARLRFIKSSLGNESSAWKVPAFAS